MISAYVDDALNPATRATMDQHLAHCQACRDEVRAEREVREQVRAAGLPVPPDDLESRILASTGVAGSQHVWLAPDDSPHLPSARLHRRKVASGALALVTASFALVIAMGWTLAPTLPVVHQPSTAEPVPAQDAPAHVAVGMDAAAAELTRVAGSGSSLRHEASPVVAAPPAVSVPAQAAALLVEAWNQGSDVDVTLCLHHRHVTRCADGTVRTAGTGLSMTLRDIAGRAVVTTAWDPLGHLAGVGGWAYLGERVVDGQAAVGLEARDRAGHPLRRWWVGVQQGALVRVEAFREGRLAASERFEPARMGGVTCPTTAVCPGEVAGLPLVAVASRGERTGLLYAAGDQAVMVLEERGVLANDSGTVKVLSEADPSDAQPVRLWQSSDRVFGLTATSLDLVEKGMACLPQEASGASGVERVKLGLRRLTGR